MAREVQILVNVTSDLSGKPIEADDNYEPFRFSFADLGDYELDLTAEEINEFNKLLAPYIAAARQPEVKAKPAKRRPRSELHDIRVWAAANGFTISDRGRIPEEVQAAYNASLRPEPYVAPTLVALEGEFETPDEPLLKGRVAKGARNPDGTPAGV